MKERKLMIKPSALKKGDFVAVVSLSSGILGEAFAEHQLELGLKRIKEFGLEPVLMPNALRGMKYLKEHPELRAEDLKAAYYDERIKGIICAIGGDDTFKILPYIMEDNDFISYAKENPKIFTGFSDTTINHLMFYKMGITTYYGPNFLCDLAELDDEMLPYTKRFFHKYLTNEQKYAIESSHIWYEERTDFSEKSIGVERKYHIETKGHEIIQGSGKVKGALLGGCLESFYDMLTKNRYEEQKQHCERYEIFPDLEDWIGKILFFETCEEKPSPEVFKKELMALKETGVFEVISAVLVGKPADEAYYEEYKGVIREVIGNVNLPVMYNLNFGHAYPRCVIPYGLEAEVNFDEKTVMIAESLFRK